MIQLKMYNLTFMEAAEKCLNGEGYIRGACFGYRYYVDVNEDGELVMKNLDSEDEEYLTIDTITLNDKYRVFKVLNKQEFDKF